MGNHHYYDERESKTFHDLLKYNPGITYGKGRIEGYAAEDTLCANDKCQKI